MASEQPSGEEIQTQQFDSCTQTLEDCIVDVQEETGPRPWAVLVGKTNSLRWELFPKEKDEQGRYNLHTIGRSDKCSCQFKQSAFVSNNHCIIYCKLNEAIVSENPLDRLEAWIEDTSANGTYINNSSERLVKHVPRMLYNNDEILLMNPFSAVGGKILSTEILKHSFVLMLLPTAKPIAPAGSSAISTPIVPQSGADIERSSTIFRWIQQKRLIQDFYSFGNKLGEGAMGAVFEGTNKSNGAKFAIKRINIRKSYLLPGTKPEDLIREAEMIRALNHPGIIHLEDVFADNTNLYLVMELSHGGDLFDRILDKGGYKEDEARKVAYRLLDAVSHLHEHGIVHRDLKPENILLLTKLDDISIKITDFGLAKQLDEKQPHLKTVCGTAQYFAPEVLARQHTTQGLGFYTVQADMWSVGVILFVLIRQDARGQILFEEPVWKQISDAAKDLIRNLLVIDPEKRLTARAALAHHFFASCGAASSAAIGACAAAPFADRPIMDTVDSSSSVAQAAVNIKAQSSIGSLFFSKGLRLTSGTEMDWISGDRLSSTPELLEDQVPMTTEEENEANLNSEVTTSECVMTTVTSSSMASVGYLSPDSQPEGRRRVKETSRSSGQKRPLAASNKELWANTEEKFSPSGSNLDEATETQAVPTPGRARSVRLKAKVNGAKDARAPDTASSSSPRRTSARLSAELPSAGSTPKRTRRSS